MSRWKSFYLALFYVCIVILATDLLYLASTNSQTQGMHGELILSPTGYNDENSKSLFNQWIFRIRAQPYNLVAFIIFLCALIHIFFATKFTRLAEQLRRRNVAKKIEPADTFLVEILRFMGEVEVIFGLWVIPLMIAMTLMYDWKTAIDYLDNCHYTEPVFVFVIMALTSTRPIIQLVENCLKAIAQLGGETIKSWWLTILTFGPMLGSFITEPAAMTISAILLSKQFYRHHPSTKCAYATLGLLFTNISVGGVLTNFAAPPVLMISRPWGWNSHYMMGHFGWKAIIGIFLTNFLYFYLLRKEFNDLDRKKQIEEPLIKDQNEKKVLIPFWISLIHVFFLAWIVVHASFPVIFIGSFLLFLGFFVATSTYQYKLHLKSPLLVGFFLAGLVVHGTLQAWWIEPILQRATSEMLMILSIILTAFNDNAEITFLASLTPNFHESLKYVVLAGAVTGGGLTIIANAPNLTGYSILSQHFKHGISALYLFLGALIPTLIMGLSFYLLRNI